MAHSEITEHNILNIACTGDMADREFLLRVLMRMRGAPLATLVVRTPFRSGSRQY